MDFELTSSRLEGQVVNITPIEFKEDDFQMAMNFGNLAVFFYEKHKQEYTGGFESLSLDNEDMDTSDDE